MKFTHVLVAEWPATKTTVNLGWYDVASQQVQTFTPADHTAAYRHMLELVFGAVIKQGRVLAAFNFPFSLPQEAISAIGGWQPYWQYLATHMLETADDDNITPYKIAADLNQQLSGRAEPFWGCPKDETSSTLSAIYRQSNAETQRIIDQQAELVSPFKMHAADAVGEAMITGIPYLWRLREALPTAVWPFEKPTQETRLVLTEYTKPAKSKTTSTDFAKHLVENIDAYFMQPVPPQAADEGWIPGQIWKETTADED